MVYSGNQEQTGNRNCSGDCMVCDKKNRQRDNGSDDITSKRVYVRVFGKILEILRFSEREYCCKLEQRDKSFHTHSLYNREVQPAINPAIASSRNGPSIDKIPGFF